MSLILNKASDQRYTASATPPYVKEAWSTSVPLSVRELINQLKVRGCHQQYVGDALYEQDRNWVERL